MAFSFKITLTYLTLYIISIDSKAQGSKLLARLGRSAEEGDPVYSSKYLSITEELDTGPSCGELCRKGKICVKLCLKSYE